ncbi:MAG: radical SAM family heme chaperone HemW [Bacteroidales bacterium]|nr:radical SAM family heme chaperone HemW [Bacteroidales bacterium]
MPSLYIHFPFCLRKCSYCAFYSDTHCAEIPLFLECLQKEMRLRSDELSGLPADSLYFGGGTPSLLAPAEIGKLISLADEIFGLSPDVEITLEANPNQLTDEYFRGLRDTPVNRLSVGVQSFSDEVLRRIRRMHTSVQAEQALALAEKHGFHNISADLIYGLPGSTLEQLERDLRRLSPLPHLSCYQLTLEEGSILELQLRKGLERLPSEDVTEAQRKLVWEYLRDAGFTHYEVSSFCRGEAWSRHNTAYWRQQPYLGFGPAAHSYLPHRRQWNLPDLRRYCKHVSDLSDGKGWDDLEGAVFEREQLTPEMEYEEYVMTSLRTCWGCDLEKVRGQWGAETVTHIRRQLRHYPENYYKLTDNQLVLTEEGLLFADGIAADLFM